MIQTHTIDNDYVIFKLEQAGKTLLSMPSIIDPPEVIRYALEALGWKRPLDAPIPSQLQIDRCQDTLAWLDFISNDRYILKRVVGARCLVHPITDRYLYPWKRLDHALNTSQLSSKRWHEQGIDRIVSTLSAMEP